MKSFVLCYITDRYQLKSVTLTEVIRETLRAGVDMVQIREKDLTSRELIRVVEEAVSTASEIASGLAAPPSFPPHLPGGHPSSAVATNGGPTDQGSPLQAHPYVLVNDRLDVALATGAAGVHLGSHSMPVAVVRQSAPHPLVVGASSHSLDEALAAESGGADYLVLGPIFETPSKLAYGPPLGLEKLRDVTSRVRIPVLALGGITLERVRPCLEAGAAGIAGIRIFQDCLSVQERLRELRAQVR